MILQSLWLKDFKNIREIDLLFDNKINLIYGNTGEGKSAILEAIGYILTDYLPDRIAEYVRWGCNKFEIRCEFKHNGNSYDYYITGGKSATKKLVINGDLKDFYRGSDATAKIKEIIDPILTRYSAISEQGKTSQLLFIGNTERLQRLKQIMRVDKIGDVTEKMKEEKDNNQQEIELLVKEITGLKDRKFNYYDVPDIPAIKDIEKKLLELTSKKELWEKEFRLYENYKKDSISYKEAQENISIVKEKIERLEYDIKAIQFEDVPDYSENMLENILKEYNNIDKLLLSLTNKREHYSSYVKRRDLIQEKIHNITENLNKNVLKRIAPLSFTQDMYDTAVKEMFLYKNRLESIKNGVCPTCGAEYDMDDTEGWQSSYDNLKESVSNFDNEKKLYEAKKQQQEIIKIKRQQLEKELKERTEELNNLEIVEEPDESQITDFTNKLNDLAKEKIECEQLKSKYNKVRENNLSLEEEKQNYERDKAVEEGKLSELEKLKEPEEVKEPEEFDLNYYEEVKRKKLLHNQLVSEAEKIKDINSKIKEEEKQVLLDITEKEEKVEKLTKRNRVLDESRKVLDKDFSSYLIDKGASYIKNKMNEFFQRAYGKYKVTFAQDKKSIDFFYAKGDERPTSVNMASGHEKKVLAIANRVSLCSLQDLGILILDEIDSDASSEMSLKLFNTLLGEKFNQFFIVTHNPMTQEYIKNQIGCNLFEVKEGNLINY